MNYLNLLRELSEQYVVKMESGQVNGDWTVLLGKHGLESVMDHNGDLMETDVIGFTVMTQAYGKTPEQAIRAAYMIVNPIPKSTATGKLSQR